MVILLPYFEDICCKDFPGETFWVLKEKEEREYGIKKGMSINL